MHHTPTFHHIKLTMDHRVIIRLKYFQKHSIHIEISKVETMVYIIGIKVKSTLRVEMLWQYFTIS